MDWTDNSDNETGFLIERSNDGSSGWVQVGSVAANTTHFQDEGMSSGTYYYRVIANALIPSVPSEVAGPITLMV